MTGHASSGSGRSPPERSGDAGTRPTDSPGFAHQSEPAGDFNIDHVQVRVATEYDVPTLRELFDESLLEGMIGDNDTGADIDNLHEGYFSDDGQSCFWVAMHQDRVIGMIGAQRIGDSAAEIRRLRVRSDFRRLGVGTVLMNKAVTFCQRQGYLKVVLDVRIERGPAINMFQKFGFTLGRVREIDGRKLLDFYLDLYRDPER